MPIEFGEDTAVFSGVCSVDEAEGLLSWMMQNPEGSADLQACEHLHAAVLQVLMACRPRLSAVPPPGFLLETLAAVQSKREE
ncbi:MAG: hypothetical protein EBS54_02245 [Betaproteobacteria bacterium]|jgi:hypothetical protein|nr:hypothetical protein [Betaproteobacteria bacterium]NBR97944.1 hypothetical protein [Betaproteobacteria bacterium]NBS92418.1 hypothetical protein [Betaproteobacteria bacterium]NBT05609.1 hypothetical protein [Betaproteobacteria bacterium]NBU11874.1 hypothetical protein [Betaproteobacteria bacterium]